LASTIAPHETAPVAPPAVAPERDVERSLVFRAGGRVYACAVTAIREIVPLDAVTRLPGAPAGVLGLINHRGAIVTVLDAGALLHDAPRDPHAPAMLLLVDVGPRGVGLAVERVADVRALRPDEGYTELDVRDLCARVVVITEEDE
jgi:purine-binding chemotaxis protein CheW